MVFRTQLKVYRLLFWFGVIFFILAVEAVSGVTSKVVLTDGGTPEFRQMSETRLTAVVNALDTEEWNVIESYSTKEGLQMIKSLVKKTDCRNVNPLYETKLLELPNAEYEVRGIKVKVDMHSTRGSPFQYLVFTLNANGLITEARFAMEQHHYQEIVKTGERLQDFAYRQKILHFLEIFRTAYNRKDLDYLKKVYSEEALIIVGTVIKEKPDSPDLLKSSSLPEDRIRFLKLTKQEYIKRLERIFQLNAFVKVRFEEVEITRHPKKPKIYGVTLKQFWRSSTYSDTGYLFLMIDFRNPDNPLIHVRSWQPERFPDGSIVSLGDFELIE